MKKETPMKRLATWRRAVALLVVVGFLAAACGGSDDSPTAAAQDDGFPLTFTNCEMEFTLDAPPERVMLMEAAAPSLLFAAGAMDRVIARIESFPEEYYTAEELALLNDIPALVAEHTSTGGVEISVEAIIDHDPDIVIGYDTATLTHDSLGDVGIQLYVMPPFCDNPPTPSFESILDEVRFYGELFGTSETANASADALEAAVASAADAPVAEGQTAAALYVSSDGSAIYAYSSLGMVHPLMEALGMTNVFAELSERVPEVSIEEVIGRNPEILVLLYDDFGLTPDEISALVHRPPRCRQHHRRRARRGVPAPVQLGGASDAACREGPVWAQRSDHRMTNP